ncbi:MAG TPA: PQQ-binding-like beta-propeller repeat protein [Stellaceae bacterium]|nr:PQQ-binding-like beta-propeller repeat protein [Stellaceae bacterium]
MNMKRWSQALAIVGAGSVVAAAAWAQDAGSGWPSYNRSLLSDRYAPLDEINRTNVAKLHPVCTYELGMQSEFETGPLVIGRILYATSEMDIFAIDAGTCKEKWRTHEDINLPFQHFPLNRGAAYLDGRLFRGTQDGRIFGYDAETGKRIWETKIFQMRGESVPAAPIAWNGMVFVGNAGGDSKGVKGRMYGLDAATGKVMWETYLVPAGEKAETTSGIEKVAAPTWGNAKDVPITGGATWTSYTLDPKTGLLYVPGGNPAPDFVAGLRPGSNLMAGSVVILDAKTGAYRKHFSIVPKDYHDWDISATPALFTTKSGRFEMAVTGKNGMLYGYDLGTNKRVFATPVTTRSNTTAPLTKLGTTFCPGASGGAEWNGPAYSPVTNLIYTGEVDWCSIVTMLDDDDTKAVAQGLPWTGAVKDALFGAHPPKWGGWLMASDAETGKIKWRFKADAPVLSGVTPTKGGLVFFGDMNGNAFAFDDATGKKLWQTKFDGAPGGGLITYMVDGHQRVAIVSGTNTIVFPLAPKANGKITIFGVQ